MEFKKSSVEELIEKNVIEKPMDGNHGSIHPKSQDFTDVGIPFITAADINSDKVDIEKSNKLSQRNAQKLKKGFAKQGDVLLTHKASVGRTAIVHNTGYDYIILSPQVTYYRIKDNTTLLPEYLYLYFKSKYFNQTINQWAGGSTRNYIGITAQRKLPIIYPSIKNQKKIIDIIMTFEYKVQTNEKIIANLEELSQTLFKRWFVDFEFPDENGNPYKSSGGEMIGSESGKIPFNWKCSKIKDINIVISDHVANGSFKSIKENVQFAEDLIDEYAVFARNVDLKKGNNKFEKYVTKTSYDFLKKTHLYGHEVIISNVGDVGSVYLSPILNKPMVLGNNQIFLNSDDKNMNYYFYLFFKSTIGKNLINSITSGSVQMKFNKTDLRNSFIILPSKNDMDNLIEIIKKHINLIESKKNENMKLTQLRDTLLPKLMSGELEIPDHIEVNEDELSI